MHPAATHAVEEDPHLNSLPHLAHKNLLDLLPQFIVADDIVLQMDIVPGMVHLPQKRLKLLLPVRVDPDIIVVCQDCLPLIQVVEDQALEPLLLRIPQLQLPAVDRVLLPPDRVFQLAFDLFHLEHPVLVEILAQIRYSTNPSTGIKYRSSSHATP